MFRYSTLFIFSILFFSSVNAQEDTTVRFARDSAIIPETDATTLFFQTNERIANPDKIILITKAKRTISLANLLKDQDMNYADHTLSDLDNDGQKELLISNFTGGAHCCDEIYIYKKIAANKYQYAAKLFAGNTVISTEKDFTYNFNEQLGYFFTCFACSYSDTSDEAPVDVNSIKLKYSKGKMLIVPGDKELKSMINDNLAKLGEQPYEKLEDDLAQDNGLRKAVALNLIVYYYSFGKNLPETQKLFNKYYKHPDSKKVWAAFLKQLQYIPKESSL